MKLVRPLWPSLAVLVLVSACASADFDSYHESISAFKSATDQTSEAVAARILTIRTWDRTRMVEQLRDAKDPCELEWVKRRKTAGQPYAVSDCAFLATQILYQGRFSREAVAARQQVFDVLNEYTSLLSAVATSDAPARWDSAAKGLGGSLESLATTINGIKTEDGSNPFADQLGPLADLVGEEGQLTALISFAGQEWINDSRTRALDRIIQTGKPEIDKLSRLLREDFDFVRKRDLFLADEDFSNAAFAYATAAEQAAADPSRTAAKNAALEGVRRVMETNETKLEEIHSIGSAMDGFDDAHAALVAYAESSKQPGDLSALVFAVKRYAAAARSAYAVFKVLSAEDAN